MRPNRKFHSVGGPAFLAIVGLAVSVWAAGEKPAANQPEGFPAPEGPSAVSAELIAEHASVQPGGSTRIGVHFDLDEGWHIYAKESGDAGLPTQITWTVPFGVTAGPLEWPPHQEFVDPGEIRTFGYSGAVVLSSPLSLNPDSALEAIPIHASVKWLACKELCVPGSAELDLSLPVSSEPQTPSAHTELFDHTS